MLLLYTSHCYFLCLIYLVVLCIMPYFSLFWICLLVYHQNFKVYNSRQLYGFSHMTFFACVQYLHLPHKLLITHDFDFPFHSFSRVQWIDCSTFCVVPSFCVFIVLQQCLFYSQHGALCYFCYLCTVSFAITWYSHSCETLCYRELSNKNRVRSEKFGHSANGISTVVTEIM